MVVQKRLPSLSWWPPERSYDSRDGAFRDGDAQHLEFAMDPWVRATADWQPPSARSIAGSRQEWPVAPDDDVIQTIVPKIYKIVPAASA
jgi:hypothetical protein